MDAMIADTIKHCKKTLEERGLPSDSFFEVEFDDGSHVSEKDVNWSAMSDEVRVMYFGGTKTVFLCTLPIKSIDVWHGELHVSIDMPEGCAAFQAIRSETIIMDGKRQNQVLGRVVGLVRDGEVIEEQFLNSIENNVVGRRA